MDENWTDRTYPFAKAQRVTQKFAQKEAPREVLEDWVIARPYSTLYVDTLEDHLPRILEEQWPGHMASIEIGLTDLERPLYAESMPAAMRDLGAAVRKLTEGALQPTDTSAIALIMTLGSELLWQAYIYFSDERGRGGLDPGGEDYELNLRVADFLFDFTEAFYAVSHQLAQDVAALRENDRPLH